MKLKNMFKVMLLGLGMGVAASAYAMSCQQCANQFDNCLMEENGARACLIEFRQCRSASNENCQLN
ncbi:MAG: hypothetical protein COB74_01200 [Shewanella sp.]|nr:MAG: hypothetical protein COB74_01200 [Shewanella sp.]